MNNKKLEIEEAELNELNCYLSLNTAVSNFGPDEIIKTYSVSFHDKIRAELDIQNTEDGPYVNAILFDDGQEVGLIEPCYELHGKYSFEYNNKNYTIEIVSK